MTKEEQVDVAYRNSYYIIINSIPVEDPYLIHNPGEKLEKSTFNDLLEYFEGMEEYEKCKKIKMKMDESF